MIEISAEPDVELLHSELQKEECHRYFERWHPDVIAWYDRYVASSGYECNFVQAALRAMWNKEMKYNAESFRQYLATGVWGGEGS